jgi:hypothetical protein
METFRDTVHGAIHFLTKDKLYKEEKPYTIRYAVPDDVPRSNSKHDEHHNIPITDIRSNLQSFSLAKNGFTVTRLETTLKYDDYAFEDRIVDIYLYEVARVLRDTLKARHVQVYEHTVRCPENKFHTARWLNGFSSYEDEMQAIRYPLVESMHSISLPILHISVCHASPAKVKHRC